MPATNAGAAVELDALRGAITHISAHSAAPVEGGASNELTTAPYARQAMSFGAAASKSIDSSVVPGIPVAGGESATHVGFWDALTGGTLLYWIALPSAQTDAADWTLQIDDADISITP